MSLLHKNFEEYNLGREKRFRGEAANAILYIVHNLDAKELEQTTSRLKVLTEFKDVQTLESSKLDELTQKIKDKDSAIFLTMHLALDQEIASHQKISGTLLANSLFQLNPYNKIAKIFDDKYLFYALLTANDIKQPYTELIAQGQVINNEYLEKIQRKLEEHCKKCQGYIIKPRNGTEKIDFMEFENLSADLVKERIKKIHKYDDCIVQERIAINQEFKVLYLEGKLHITQSQASKSTDKALFDELYQFVDLIEDHAKLNQIIMPEIFSMDILETMDRGYMILEANIRPGALYKF